MSKDVSNRNIEFKQSFGMRLRSRRIGLGLSQEKLGVIIGLDESCSRTRISRYENDLHEPASATIRQLAQALDTPVPYFYCEDNLMAELILIINRINSAQRMKLIKFLKQNLSES
jgi:transcriptional regulator with XRE-family HTH domain